MFSLGVARIDGDSRAESEKSLALVPAVALLLIESEAHELRKPQTSEIYTMFAKKVLTAAVAALLVLPMAGCSFFSTPDSHEPAELQDFKPLVKAKVSWTADVGENSGFLVPVVTENAVYAAGDNRLYRLDRNTGDTVWSVETGGRVTAGVGTDGMHQAVVTDRGEVELYDAEGRMLWHAMLSAETDVPPLVGQNLVIVKTSDTRITAFDLITGERRWHYQGQAPALTLQAFSQMTWSPAGILVGQANGRLLALGLDGKPVFDAVIGQAKGITEVERLIDVVGRPWVDQQLICAAAFQGQLVCMSSQNGQLAWNVPVDAVTGPVSDSQLIYVVDDRSGVHAFNRQTGREAWVNRELEYRTVSAPIRIGGTVAVADYEGVVTMMNPANGGVVGRTKLDGAVRAPATQFGYGALYQTADGEVALVLQESIED